ncbi:DNA-binding protein HU-beta [Thermosulfidibacter takaii ABI70S6]|uniref:DNA-binding protein HU-beta n=1 Tax=Thermosulfidibacter takaii (strain DSM 17441 / JCM 13301 / NBRC 103674 / ABI70S6) TaxID=1298851 RepID=A0A0S3QRJ5_THET7|nr:HU family DNA-binding protein [Thermosulfidibacter takaii]BAT70959.1 DNA-binding protein HU-beta [Thermosulfidibacter takaii ABI70S6]
MTKADLVSYIAKEAGLTKANAEKALDAFVKAVMEALAKGEKVTLVGFGTFYVSERAERRGRNPQTKEEIIIPACKVPKFKPGKLLKEKVK